MTTFFKYQAVRVRGEPGKKYIVLETKPNFTAVIENKIAGAKRVVRNEDLEPA